MAIIIPGYEYDIFISYRQKDNKLDGWVTEFVNNLKGELESTFKEEISVYFDINPHDGLLETHDVNASLKEKLKCLIFIPIISQTYCDPQSFAWQQEFCAFNKLCKEDQFGRDIRLSSGNVTSRILPVKIHDLDAEDKTLLENELGGVLRSIDFIYKASGVNRPLKPKDERAENLNHTYYPDQINKVANAVKEIITAIKKQTKPEVEVPKEIRDIKHGLQKKLNPKILIGSFLVLVLLAVGYFFIPKLFKSSEQVEKSIAVLPFKLLSDEPDKQYLADGMMEAILLNLSKIKDLRVIPGTSVEQFRVTTKTTQQIGKELGVEYLLEGRFQKDGNNVRLIVKLIKGSKESYEWANEYNRNWNDVFSVQSEVAQAIASELKAKFTPEEKQLIEKIPSTDLAAYDSYLKGVYYLRKNNNNDLETALKYFELSKDKDPKFALAYAGICYTWTLHMNLGDVPSAKAAPKAMEAIMRAIELDSTSAEVQRQLASLKLFVMWDWKGAESGFKKTIALYPNYGDAYRSYANVLIFTGRTKEAMEQIDLALKLDPLNPGIKVSYGLDLIYVHKYDKALSALQDVLRMNPSNWVAIGNIPVAYHLLGKYKEGFESWKLYYNTVYKDFVHVFDRGFAKGGYFGALNLEADTLVAQSKTAYFLPTEIAILYACAGNKGRALDMLERAYDVRDPNLVALRNPIFDCLRNEPRYQDLCRKMNLPYE
jgi:TolB-like protein/Tfp pilus assembly protein PilF